MTYRIAILPSLEGIEYFTALDTLYCSNNQLTALDVSNCTLLKILSCDYNQLTALDVSGCTALQELDCSENQLTALNVSGCTQLTTLNLSSSYDIVLDNDRTFDLSGLPGNFDVNKASNWRGGSVNGNILTVDACVMTVVCTYDFGNGITADYFLRDMSITPDDVEDVEDVDDDEEEDDEDDDEEYIEAIENVGNTENAGTIKSPKTGENTNLPLLIVLLSAFGFGILGTSILSIKKRNSGR